MEPFSEPPDFDDYIQEKLNSRYEAVQAHRRWRAAYNQDQNEAYLPFLAATRDQLEEMEVQADIARALYRNDGPDPRYPLSQVFWESKFKGDIQ